MTHPGRYGYIVRAPIPGDAAWEAAAAEILSILDDVFTGYGIIGADAVDAARFVRSVLHGFVSLELGSGFGLPQSADASFRRLVDATNGHSVTGDPRTGRPAMDVLKRRGRAWLVAVSRDSPRPGWPGPHG